MTWFAALLAAWAGGFASAETLRLTVFHTNDIHGSIMPKGASGGMASLARLVRGHDGPKLLLDAGDWFEGTPEGLLSRGEAVTACFNAVGYDAVAVGNHEYDLGEQRLRELAGTVTAPVLGANVYDEASGSRVGYLKPYVIKEIEGVKVGVFGLLTSSMRRMSFERNIRGLRFRSEVEEARDMVRELRERGATVIIALTHVGFEEAQLGAFQGDRFLASMVPGIDLIVGGHTHTALKEPVRDPANGTLIVQAGASLAQAGRVDLDIDLETGRVKRSRGRLVPLTSSILGQASDVKAIVARFQKQAGKKLDVVVGQAPRKMGRERFVESDLGDWITDCMRRSAGADLAFQNSGGIRSELPAGPVTLRRIFEVMAFDNHVATMTFTGAQVKEILEQSVSHSFGLLQVSGLSFRYRERGQPGSRVGDVRVGGKPLKLEGAYTAALPDFMADGKGGYSVLGQGSGKAVTGDMERDVLIECARKQSVIRAPAHDRIFKL